MLQPYGFVIPLSNPTVDTGLNCGKGETENSPYIKLCPMMNSNPLLVSRTFKKPMETTSLH